MLWANTLIQYSDLYTPRIVREQLPQPLLAPGQGGSAGSDPRDVAVRLQKLVTRAIEVFRISGLRDPGVCLGSELGAWRAGVRLSGFQGLGVRRVALGGLKTYKYTTLGLIYIQTDLWRALKLSRGSVRL